MQSQDSVSKNKRAEELEALSRVLSVLDGLSNSQVRSVLQMAAAQHSMRVVSINAPVAVQQMRPVPKAQQRNGRGGSAPQPKAENQSPLVRSLKVELKAVQEQLRSARESGEELSDSHPLVQQRNDLLGRIVQAKCSFRRSGTEDETESKTQDP